MRLNDRADAPSRKPKSCSKIKPGHHRALEVQEKYCRVRRRGRGADRRLGAIHADRWNEGGWIPWSVLAFGLAVFGVMAGVDRDLSGQDGDRDRHPGSGRRPSTVKGIDAVVTGPEQSRSRSSLATRSSRSATPASRPLTKSFTIKKGEKRTVTVSIVNKEIVARLEDEICR